MKEFFETTTGRIALIIIVLGVWGVNVVQFSDVFTSGEVVAELAEERIDLDELTAVSTKKFSYEKTRRDPFNEVQAKTPEPQVSAEAKEEYSRPRIAVLGVMDETIMVIDETRAIIVVKEQDVFNGITVISITQDSVIFEHNNKPFVIKVRS